MRHPRLILTEAQYDQAVPVGVGDFRARAFLVDFQIKGTPDSSGPSIAILIPFGAQGEAAFKDLISGLNVDIHP